YEGERAVFVADSNQLELTGTSRVEQGRNMLETDSLLVYHGRTGVVCGYGAPVLSGENDPIESDELCFDIESNVGLARRARTQFQQGATWFVRGADNRVWLLTGGEKNELYGERAEFTSCDLDHPHYTFHARSLKMVEDEMMVARDITLRFADVPVFWLPWMVQSMKRGRRSGLLMPEFGVNDIVRNSTGYNRHLSNIGFYWAINDYMSARGTFEWYSGNWTAVEGALTYRWLRQFLQGNLTTKQYWRQREGVASSREFTLNTSNSWQPDERTRVQLNANYATSTDFVRDNSFDPRELNRRITSSASVSRTFDWGSMSLGADRQQQLSTGQVDWKLPGLSLNISPVTLYQREDGFGVTWRGSGGVTRSTRDVADSLFFGDQETVNGNYSHGISIGNLSLSQRVTWQDRSEVAAARLGPFSIPTGSGLDPVRRATDDLSGLQGVVEENAQQLQWSSSLSYQQVLWPGTTISPNLSITGNQVRDGRTEGDFVAEPYRLSTGASLNTAIYGFWPGFADFSRIRHKISPSLRWSYSPAPEFSARQEEVFGARNLREQNRVSLSFNQTFEAKVREDQPDTAAADTAGADTAQDRDRGGEPRRLTQARKVMLLALDTRTSFVYDFVAADDEGRGFLTEQISNSVRSDLLKGLQLSTTHSLFRKGEPQSPGGLEPRTFDPFLTDLTASFSIDNDFWLFEVLGLTRTADAPAGPGQDADPPPQGVEGVAGSEDPSVGAESDPDRTGGVGSMVPSGPQDGEPGAGLGAWRASFNYSLRRSRPDAFGRATADNQLLSANISFEPTELWSVRWSTAYSFTDGEFANHVLTLSRDLHRWQANFDFIKAQNGNFAMQFRVQLRDNPDLKVDYDQRTDPSERGAGRGGQIQR
ncbi:MAG: putative LPS assembly protein LptD, partial [Gemmatimonadota bacterium]